MMFETLNDDFFKHKTAIEIVNCHLFENENTFQFSMEEKQSQEQEESLIKLSKVSFLQKSPM